MSHQPASSPQPPTRRAIISLWIGIVVFLATTILGVLAFIVKQNIVVAIITFLAALLSIPIGILQINPQLFVWARQTIRTGLLVSGIVLLVASLGLNVLLIIDSQAHAAPVGAVSTPTALPTVMRPIPTDIPPSLPPLVKDAEGQYNENLQSGSLTTVIKAAFPFSITARNLIVVAITQWEGTVTSVTDTPGDTYIQVPGVPHANTSRDYVELYYAKSVIGGATTVTVHFSTAGDSNTSNDMNVGIYEYSGLDTTHPLDQVVSHTGYGSDLDGGMLRSTTGNELYFVVGVDDDGNNTAPTAGSGYTLMKDHQDDSQNERFYAEERIAGPGSFPTDFSIATSSYWAIIGVSFKPA